MNTTDNTTRTTTETQEYLGLQMLTITTHYNYPAGYFNIKKYQVVCKDGTKSKIYNRRGDATNYLVKHI